MNNSSFLSVCIQHTQRVTSIDWAPNGNRIVTCGTVRFLSLFHFFMEVAHHKAKKATQGVGYNWICKKKV